MVSLDSIRYSRDSPDESPNPPSDRGAVGAASSALIQLLASATRASKWLVPEVYEAVRSAAEKLRLTSGSAAFVRPSPELQATCFLRDPGISDAERRVVIVFNSALIELLTAEELTFVAGHELGHLVFRHHECPVTSEDQPILKRLTLKENQRCITQPVKAITTP